MCRSHHAAVHCVQHTQSWRQLGSHAEQALEYARPLSVLPRSLENSRLTSPVSIEFSLSICVACLPVLAPFFKRIPALASLIPSIRSRFTSRSNGTEKDGSRRARDIAGSRSQTDVERGVAPGQEHKGHSSWHAPRGWQKQTSGEYELGSQGSQTTLQPVLPTYRELRHKD